MFEYRLIEVDQKSDYDKIDFTNDKNCLLFFHYDKLKAAEDHFFVKKFEEKYKYNLNWIDISDIFDDYKKLHKKLNFNLQYTTVDENQIILNYIKEYIYDQFIRTCKYYKI